MNNQLKKDTSLSLNKAEDPITKIATSANAKIPVSIPEKAFPTENKSMTYMLSSMDMEDIHVQNISKIISTYSYLDLNR